MTSEDTRVATTEDNRMSFGQTQLRPEDFVPPRVKVCQQMSQEVADKKADAGDFFNTLTGENYGPAMRIQPILPFMQRIFMVREAKREKANELLVAKDLEELSDGDGLKCRSYDMFEGRGEPGIDCNDCPLSKWTTVDRKQVAPLCSETYNIAASNEIGELVIVSFARSSAKNGKKFFSSLRMRPGAPWLSFYNLSTRLVRNDLGNFYVPDFTIDKERPDTALIAQAVHWAEQLKGVRVDQRDVTPDEDIDKADDIEGSGAGGDLPF